MTWLTVHLLLAAYPAFGWFHLHVLFRTTYDDLRRKVIDMVIYTDMGKHFETVEKFSHLCSANTTVASSASVTSESSFKSTGNGLKYLPLPPQPVIIVDTPDNCNQIMRMVIKVADVSNPARDRDLMKSWAYRIAEEYFDQFDEEQKLQLPVCMPTFERATCNIPKSQMSFAEIFLDKMFMNWNAFLHIPEVVEQLQDNYKYWQTLNTGEDPLNNPA